MNRFLAGAAMIALVSAPLSAQTSTSETVAATAAPDAAAPSPGVMVLPVGSEISLAMSQEINSTENREGDTFPLSVVSDVRLGDHIVIPRGTRAVGEITWRTGRGAFGKSGKMDIALRYIDLDGARIPIEGTFRQEGNGQTLATVAGVIAVGIFAGFITGHRARIPAGRELMSRTAYPIPFTMPGGHLAPSYDARVAVAAAMGNSPQGQCHARAVEQSGGDAARAQRAERECLRGRNRH